MTEQTLSPTSAEHVEPTSMARSAGPALGRPAWVAITYAVLGLAWISYSDRLLLAMAPDMVNLANFGRLKGMAFVLFTGLLLYRLLQRRDRQSSQLQDAEQAERQRAWRLLEAIAESSTDAIYAKDVEGRYLFANREVGRLLGTSVAHLLGKTAAHLLSAKQAEQLAAEDHAALVAEHPISVEATLNTTDGERIYLSTKGALRDRDGNTLGVFGVSRDSPRGVAKRRAGASGPWPSRASATA